MLRKVLWSVATLGCLAIAFVAGGGSVATATQGSAVIAGQGNFETHGTAVCHYSSGTCSGGIGDGFEGDTDTTGGVGILGRSSGSSGIAVGADATGTGSVGVSTSGGQYGVLAFGDDAGSTGVYGQGPAYGVHGKAGGSGVWGEGQNGVSGTGTENGVLATGGTFGLFATGTDYGVYASAPNHGIYGAATDNAGAGVEAQAASAQGIGLRVTGKVELSRSGVATIAGTSTTPLSSVVVSGVALSGKSIVFTTVQKNITGTWVRAAVPNVGGSSVTIYLNKAVTKSVPVAWMVIEQP